MTVTRISAADDPTEADPYDWATEPAVSEPDTYTPDIGEAALQKLGDVLLALLDATDAADVVVGDAVRALAERLDVGSIVATVDLVQGLKRRLGLVEAMLAREAGILTTEGLESEREGFLTDGRPYIIRRAANRKAWDHAEWKGAVRKGLAKKYGIESGELIDPDTEEAVNVYLLMAELQAVTGSATPNMKPLKALGLDPADYCETYPGPYTVQITKAGSDPLT